jgi:hypothetical protein
LQCTIIFFPRSLRPPPPRPPPALNITFSSSFFQ